MARISRVVASGYPHHVTQRGVRSIPIFDDDGDRNAYLDLMLVRNRNLLGLVDDWSEYLNRSDEPLTQTTLL